jgi:ABC-type dipeptide/oligopeptide/nickel transport system permease component
VIIGFVIAFVVVAGIIVDPVYALLDPRVRIA